MKMFTNVTAFLVTMAVPCVRKYFCSLNWNEYVLSLAKAWGGGGGISVTILVAVHTMFMPSTCGIFVHKLGTCIETSITSFGSFFFL